jgi:hypothetical protein
MKNIVLFCIGIIAVVGIGFGMYQTKIRAKPLPIDSTLDSVSITPSQTTSRENTVPLPTQQDIIRSFFTLINDKRVDDAITMMTDEMAGDSNTKNLWKKQFQAMKSVTVVSIAPYTPIEPGQKEEYAVNLDIVMTPESVNEMIPQYGYENGQNMRFMTMTKLKNGMWRIAGIATGP